MKTILGKENSNKMQEIQTYLLNQMGRLDDNEVMKSDEGKKEIMRSGALSQSATAFVKSVQTQMRILELSGKYNVEPQTMNEFLGIEKSDE